MCPKLSWHQENNAQSKVDENKVSKDNALANSSTNPEVFLQTLVVRIKNGKNTSLVRAMIDTGSQKSYLLENTAKSMKFICQGKERLIHSLFGGVETIQQEHKRYEVSVSSLDEKYSCDLNVLGQDIIVNEVSHIKGGVWTHELDNLGIKLTDTGKIRGPIQLLMGADIAGKLFTSRQEQLNCGLVAMETKFGWTLIGRVSKQSQECIAISTISLFVKEAKICDLWDLDILGIRDPIETKSKHEKDEEVQQRFLHNIQENEDGRYEVKLPWVSEKTELPTNYEAAEKRLYSLTKKLKLEGNFENYDQVFKEWCSDGIIGEITTRNHENGHYLPHRHVVKENSTTKIRPVFDASAKMKNSPSLNDCLEIGPNLIERIPAILLRFRRNKIGVIADIKRAFLQISISKEDREFLKFLWWDAQNQIKEYQHMRVVFGVSSSPFLLAAVIDYHLNKILNQLNVKNDSEISKTTLKQLINSFYVDNCVTSVTDHHELERFIHESKIVMSRACFDLRGWEYTEDNIGEINGTSMVLGLKWRKDSDTLEVKMDNLPLLDNLCVTKRQILSVAHRMFDPIGFLCPITIFSKLLLQEIWKSGLPWDAEVDEEMKIKFRNWYQELARLTEIKIPRWLIGDSHPENISIHTFCDASKNAYATAVFIRIETINGVRVQLIQAKSRIAPLKKITIPRLELMAAVVGARLTTEILKNLEFDTPIPVTYWSDSSTVLAWIKRNEKWEVFVKNRVQEIRQLTKIENWKQVPGECNPADLPSRGCSIRQLLELKWWEGPSWLKLKPIEWPQSKTEDNEIESERETMKSLTAINPTGENVWYYEYFSSYEKIIRLVAWVMRFINNCKSLKEDRIISNFTSQEVTNAEKQTFKLIQQEWFNEERIKDISSLNTFQDQDGIIRVKTRITLRNDTENFRFPIVLPDQHPVVKLLILDRHTKIKHAGVQILLNHLREDYWITRGRRAVRNVIKGCLICKKHEVQNMKTSQCSLPLDRVRDARVFEVVGIDFAGPLHLKKNVKVWICLFTCAVYRTVHLEIVSSLSTPSFIQAFRRFIARRGRPRRIYSDNGTNFAGTANLLSSVNWLQIEEFATAHRIEWKFNPPTAAWWGGWWERLTKLV